MSETPSKATFILPLITHATTPEKVTAYSSWHGGRGTGSVTVRRKYKVKKCSFVAKYVEQYCLFSCLFRAILFVQSRLPACPLGNTPNPGAQEACPSGNIKNALSFTHRMWGPLVHGIDEIYAGLFNTQIVHTGTSKLEISRLSGYAASA